MPSESFKKTFVFLLLGLLTVSAFFIRLENFKNSQLRSIDEIVYYRMAKQVLDEGLSGYHTIPYGKDLAAKGRPLPDYFFKPLFKHPPLFTLMNAASMKLFGNNLVSSSYVSLLFGVLLIPLTYLLGTILFCRKVGIGSALFMWIEPVSIMTSQKVWMDTTIAFFMLTALLLFAYGIHRNKNSFYIWSGIFASLAVLTKYTGIFVTVSMGLFAYVYHRELFRNKSFVASLFLPFVLLLPWIYWNMHIYGSQFLLTQRSMHMNEHVYGVILIMFLLIAFLFTVLKIMRNKQKTYSAGENRQDIIGKIISRKNIDIMLGCALLVLVVKSALLSLQMDKIPRASWTGSVFRNEPMTFYVGQLIEYSFIYFFAFVSFFVVRKQNIAEISLLRYGTLVTLIFFTLWKSFQCRYILFAVPLLTILAFELIFKIYEKMSRVGSFPLRLFLKSSFLLLVAYSIGRTVLIDFYLSFPNNMCYF